MNLILFDSKALREQLLPFTFTRPIAEIRVGICTITQKWEAAFDVSPSFLVPDYLASRFPLRQSASNLLVNGALCPREDLIRAIRDLKDGQALVQEGILLAGKCDQKTLIELKEDPQQYTSLFKCTPFLSPVVLIQNVWDIFLLNGSEICRDFELITQKRTSKRINDPHTKIYKEENLFIEEGAIIQAAVLNANTGPIYIGKNAEIMEGAVIRGPFALGEGAVVNMGSKIRENSTVGPYSKVGGEISNSVIFGYSNKSHDGFLGNSVLGEWCNLGASTNTSNLKNNYSEVKLWSYVKRELVGTGRQFCGLMMGDHSRSGINTMFNTGTVVGVGANIFGTGFPPKFIPSFSWSEISGEQKFSTYTLDKFIATAKIIMKRRNKELKKDEENILTHIFEQSAQFRNRKK